MMHEGMSRSSGQQRPQQGHGHREAPPAPAPAPRKKDPLLPDADPRYLEDYADQLYEDKMDLKVNGAKCILRVCTEPPNLIILAEHDTLLGVLSRELRESAKKSFDLSVAIVCTFLCFSRFSQFHPVLMQHRCGDVMMRVLEYESQRAQVRREDMERRVFRLQELGDNATAEDKKLLAKDEKKHKLQIKKQSKLILVCVMGLLNLAEEISIEKKMVNRKMTLLLVQLLDRSQEDLLLVVLQFLKKLSVFEQNKEEICSNSATLSLLVQLAQNPSVRVALLALRLLYNLSFDERVRGQLVESGVVKLLVDHLRNPPFRGIVLRLLYHFSMDDRCKSLMAYHRDGIVMLLQLVVHFPEARVGKDLVALVVNLATHPRAAEAILSSGLFPQVIVRVLKTRDPLLCKVIRNVSSHRDVIEPMHELLQSDSVRMSKWMTEFTRTAVCSGDSPELLLELLGTLANMTLENLPWGELCEAGLIEMLTRLMVPSFAEDDIVLECVMLTGNLALCRESAQHVAASRIPVLLQELLIEKRDDEELVVQLLYSLQCLLVHEEVREIVLQETELAPTVMRFSRSSCPAVIEQAGQLLQVVVEHAGNMAMGNEEESLHWVEQIKAFRFEQHNSEWCHYVLEGSLAGSPMSAEEGQSARGDGEQMFQGWSQPAMFLDPY